MARNVLLGIALLLELTAQGRADEGVAPEKVRVILNEVQPLNMVCPYCAIDQTHWKSKYWIRGQITNGTYYLSESDECEGYYVVKCWSCIIPASSEKFTIGTLPYCTRDGFLESYENEQLQTIWFNRTGASKILLSEMTDGTFVLTVYGHDKGNGVFFSACYAADDGTYLDAAVGNSFVWDNYILQNFCPQTGWDWRAGYGGTAVIVGIYDTSGEGPGDGGIVIDNSIVNGTDLARFGESYLTNPDCDYDGSGRTDLYDLQLLGDIFQNIEAH